MKKREIMIPTTGESNNALDHTNGLHHPTPSTTPPPSVTEVEEKEIQFDQALSPQIPMENIPPTPHNELVTDSLDIHDHELQPCAQPPLEIPSQQPPKSIELINIEPDSFWSPGGVPIFKPTLQQFASFEVFIKSIAKWGQIAGIIKIIPPVEWKENYLTPVDDRLAQVRIKNAIKQEINGGGLPEGAYFQMNLAVKRSFSVKEWHDLADSDEYRAPSIDHDGQAVFPYLHPYRKVRGLSFSESIVNADENSGNDADVKTPSPPPFSPSGKDARYQAKFTGEEIAALEKAYWNHVITRPAMYGADLLGSLFDPKVKENAWNVSKLDNLLSRVNVALQGVNRSYLYFGMWKSTFAWHVEDMDLCSINYIHFGAPKQWYVVPPAEQGKFERAARNLYFTESRNCKEFLRHKTSLISPEFLDQKYGIHVNRLVQNEGEFVITFPYAYHQGYNLGFNCAESVNFAFEDWIEVGKKADYCHCTPHSVRLNVPKLFENKPLVIKKRIRSDEDPSSSNSSGLKMVKVKPPPLPPKPKSKWDLPEKRCILCPFGIGELLETDVPGQLAHKTCGNYIPETYIDTITDPTTGAVIKEIVRGIESIPKSRKLLRCVICRPPDAKIRQNAGACIQCAKGRCVASYHVSCAESAGIRLDEGEAGFLCYCPAHDTQKRAAVKKEEEEKLMAHAADLFAPGTHVLARTGGMISEAVVISFTGPDSSPSGCLVEFGSGCRMSIPLRALRPITSGGDNHHSLESHCWR